MGKKYITGFLTGCSILAFPVHGALAQTATTTVTRTNVYNFPGQTTPTSQTTTGGGFNMTSCTPIIDFISDRGGSDGNSGERSGSYGDSNGDGVTDSGGYTPDPPGSDDGWGDGGQTSGTPGQSSWGGGGGDSGGGGGVSVLCTYFYKKGLIPKHIFVADLMYGLENVSPQTLKGYHAWAIPLIGLLQTGNYPRLEKFLYKAVWGWAHQMAYKRGVYPTGNVIGYVMTKTVEPFCTLVGFFVTKSYSQPLWRSA
jgi:hypothetical protein